MTKLRYFFYPSLWTTYDFLFVYPWNICFLQLQNLQFLQLATPWFCCVIYINEYGLICRHSNGGAGTSDSAADWNVNEGRLNSYTLFQIHLVVMLQERGMKFFGKGGFKIDYGYHRFNKRREFWEQTEIWNWNRSHKLTDQIITWKEKKENSLSN